MRPNPAPTLLSFAVLFAIAGCMDAVDRPDAARAAQAIGAAAPMTDTELLARGEYMVRMGGCNDCHTPGWNDSAGQLPTQHWLTGSPLGNKGPWGTTYPANLRLKVADMDEATWMSYTANLHTRPLMPDFAVRAMHEEDRRAIYRFIHSLGPAGQPAPAFLPPGQDPSPPYLELVLPPAPPAGH
ncbi:cytochrome C [Cognatiluteimonas profundi]|uniref:cytochrome C n=1 Tax=Cognatiluteimonas profundi TaxID=2594501 RepID=UPI003CCDDBEC